MLLIALFACNEYELVEKQVEMEPLSLTVTSPTYGEFLGDGPVQVTGTVSPAAAAVWVNGAAVRVRQDGTFGAEVAFTDRAMVVDVKAAWVDEELRTLVPVFDSVDPRPYDPGAVQALLTPTGLDALEPLVAAQIDALDIPGMLGGLIPAIDTDYFDLVPTGVTASPATADLYPMEDAIGATATINDLTIGMDISVLGYAFPAEFSISTITLGLGLQPALADDMLTLAINDLVVEIDAFDLTIIGIELPGFVFDYIVEPIIDLVLGGVDGLGDLILSSLGAFELGGPFAFSFDLMGTELSARLAEVGADMQGVGLGLTIGIGEEAATELPAGLATLPATTPSGLNYQLGAAVHEGLFNTLMDGLLSDFLNLELQLDGGLGEVIGTTFRALPGGDQVPAETSGWCLALTTGEARVVRMVPGDGTVLARGYLPDVQVAVSTRSGDSACEPWLNATLFGTVDLTLEGTQVSADLGFPGAWVTYYGAEGVDEDAVATQLVGLIGPMVGLLAGGQLSFDLGAVELIPGLTLQPDIIEIAPLDETGLYGIYTDVF